MLYVCPTPIGNLRDITLRVLDVLGSVEAVACEDTRHTGRLLAHYGIKVRLVSFQEHNEDDRLGLLVPLLQAGKDVALVSDAGMPGVSDPGYVLVRACVDNQLPVTVLPGPSAVDTALVISGLSTDRYTFVGFLPRERKKAVPVIETAGLPGGTVVAFESARRLNATLRLVAERWPERVVVVCRELTKLHEQVVRGTAAEVLAELPDRVRGEIVLLLAPLDPPRAAGWRTGEGGGGEEALRAVLEGLLGTKCSTKEAARLVASLTGVSQRELYSLAVAVRSERA